MSLLNTMSLLDSMSLFDTMGALDWVTVPAGTVWMGCDVRGDEDERPVQRVNVASFHLARTPITNAQYLEFVRATNRALPGHWWQKRIPQGLEQHPVTYVDWFDASAFAEWCGGRLPTEAEWERAARGDDQRSFPWGDVEPDATRANYRMNLRTTCPVGQFPNGASPYGILDLAGNVWEWVSSLYMPYPCAAGDGREDRNQEGMRVVRGGSYIHTAHDIRCSARHRFFPTVRDPYMGFRIARDI